MPTAPANITTAEQLLEAGDIGPCELVRGNVIMMTPAGYLHGRVVLRIATQLCQHVDRHRLGAVTAEQTGFVVARDPDSVYAPDVAFVTKKRLPTDGRGYFEGAPDLAAEVLSPSNSKAHIQVKLADYFAAGTRIVWVVDPQSRTAVIHRPDAEPQSIDCDGALTAEELLSGFSLRLPDIFAGM